MSNIVAHDNAIFVDQDDKTLDKVIKDLKEGSSSSKSVFSYFLPVDDSTNPVGYGEALAIYESENAVRDADWEDFRNKEYSYSFYFLDNSGSPITKLEEYRVTDLYNEHLYIVSKKITTKNYICLITYNENSTDININIDMKGVLLSEGIQQIPYKGFIGYDGFILNDYEINGLKVIFNKTVDNFGFPVNVTITYNYNQALVMLGKGIVEIKKVTEIFKDENNAEQIIMKVENDDTEYIIGKNTHMA